MMGKGDQPPEDVSSLLQRLRFVSSSAPAVYLNERLASELFISQLGAIGSFARAAGRGVDRGIDVGVPPIVVRIGASRESSQQVSYDLGNPLTKALLLHSALGGEQALGTDLDSQPGTFLEVIGAADLPPASEAHPAPAPEMRATIAAECERQTQVVQALGDSDTVLLPLLLTDERGTVGAVINRRWIRQDLAASYLPQQQVAFGMAERVVEGLSLLTIIYMRPFI